MASLPKVFQEKKIYILVFNKFLKKEEKHFITQG